MDGISRLFTLARSALPLPLAPNRTWGSSAYYSHVPGEDLNFDVVPIPSSASGKRSPYPPSSFPQSLRSSKEQKTPLPRFTSDDMPTSRSFTRYILPIGLVVIGCLAIVGTALPSSTSSYWGGSRLHDVSDLEERIQEGAPILGL